MLAAPGLIALEVMSKRLHEDHILAKRLSEGRLVDPNYLVFTLFYYSNNKNI